MDAQPESQPDRTEERRKQIMDAAVACFARKGYHNTTMDDIVAERKHPRTTHNPLRQIARHGSGVRAVLSADRRFFQRVL
jgi:hypothetical protein